MTRRVTLVTLLHCFSPSSTGPSIWLPLFIPLPKTLSLLRALLSEAPDKVNSVDVDERTALHWAASSGYIDIITYLLENGAEVDRVDWRRMDAAALLLSVQGKRML
ncbi:hypothetical protein DL96DRAFT_1274407 [Flagelloscypha sp. PMI_526]|nr:hypothetical protein DL96DRAFT_1274407 [Flagelloscypha sp. PMI_526]